MLCIAVLHHISTVEGRLAILAALAHVLRCSFQDSPTVWASERLCPCVGSLDGVLCIAVLHHISTVERRLVMLAELARVLRCGGRAIVTVWASEQEQPGKLAKWLPIGPGEQSG